MKSPLLALIIIVAVGAVIGAGILLDDGGSPERPTQETFYYSISAEDVLYPVNGFYGHYARVTVTLDHAPSSPLYVLVDTGEFAKSGLVMSGTSGSFMMARDHYGDEWEEGRVWTSSSWSATATTGPDYHSGVPVPMIKTQTVNV